MAQSSKDPKKTLKRVRLAGEKYPVARDGEVIGEWFIKNIRYLKCRENLRPSDHIFKDGKWQLLFKATKGYFWRWVKKDVYEKMCLEETEKAEKYVKKYRILAEMTHEEDKKRNLLAVTEYEQLLVYIQVMLRKQKIRWTAKDEKKKPKAVQINVLPHKHHCSWIMPIILLLIWAVSFGLLAGEATPAVALRKVL